MNFIKSKPLTLFFLIVSFIVFSCGKIHETPSGCVVAFIVAAEQKDMTKAWNILGPQAQNYYNSQGEKMRKSGKGALENEINRISKFRSVKKDYRIETDSANANIVKIVTIGGPVHIIETINVDGNFKIKDETSLKHLLDGITAQLNTKETY
jgi:hypothetical protein